MEQTGISQKGEGLEEMSQRTYMPMCIARAHRPHGEGGGGGWRGTGEKVGDIRKGCVCALE